MNMARARAHYRHGVTALRADLAAVAEDQERERLASLERIASARRAEAAAEAARNPLTRGEITGARLVRDRTGWHRVVRVSAKSVTVETAWSWTERIAHDQILEVKI